MAEIKVEKKKPIWPWIIAALIILAILYFLFAGGDDEIDVEETYDEQVMENDALEEEEVETAQYANTAGDTTSQYLSYIGDQSKMGIDHEYTNNALIQLMNAVQSKANQFNVNIEADMQQVRQAAEMVTKDPMSLKHADKIKSAGTKIANALETIQKEKFPDMSSDVQEVKTAVEKIQPAVPTLDQKDAVNSFYKEAGDVLQKMS